MTDTESRLQAEPCPYCGEDGEVVPLLGYIWKCGTHQPAGRTPVPTRECLQAADDMREKDGDDVDD